MLSRRTIFKYGFLGAGLLAVGGIGLGLQTTKKVNPTRELQVLSPDEFSILYAIAERLLPTSDSFPSASELQVTEQVDFILSTADIHVQTEIKQVLQLFENALVGTLFEGHTSPFTQSPPETQDILLRNWQQSSLTLRRTAFKALHGLCGAAYYSNAETHRIIGYAGPPTYLLKMVHAAGEK